MSIITDRKTKVGIALGSGGSKGAYQLGFYKALRELGISYHVVTGASIGSLNGAVMAMNDLGLLDKLWAEIELDDIMKNGINIDDLAPGDFGKSLKLLASMYVKGGIDISPFRRFIEKYIDIERIMSSPVDFGVTVSDYPFVRMPGEDRYAGAEIVIKETDRSLVIDYLLASCSYRTKLAPIFAPVKIKGRNYIDGAFFDPVPIDLAFRLGADYVIAVDLRDEPAHPRYIDDPRVTYIKSYHGLGSPMNIKEERLTHNEQLGYLDTMKAFHVLTGYYYSFYISGRYDEKGRILSSAAGKPGFQSLKAALTGGIRGRITPRQYYVRMLEMFGRELGVDYLAIYSFDEFNGDIEKRVVPYDPLPDMNGSEDTKRFIKSKSKETQFGIIREMVRNDIPFTPAFLDLLKDFFPNLVLYAFHLGADVF